MKKEIIFIFIEDYPDWESAEALYFITVLGEKMYEVKVAGMTKKPIRSVSGVSIVPDYDVSELSGKFDGLILVGGIGWTNHTNKQIAALEPVILDAVSRNCPIGGVGTGADVMAALGLLNHALHTGNSSSEMYLMSDLGHSGSPYTGETLFREAGAVRNGNIVTARNISGLAFARAYMWTLEADQHEADRLYKEHKEGALMPLADAGGEYEKIVI